MDCEPHGPAKDTERGGWDDERDGQGSRILKLVDQSFCDFLFFTESNSFTGVVPTVVTYVRLAGGWC
jgi:hypothetical protein